MPDPDEDPAESAGSRGISDALLTALTTDQFVLQSAAATTVSEAVGRSALYVAALSSALVAVGFATGQPGVLEPMLAIVIPTIFVLGIFTIVRLVDTSIANIMYLTKIELIRRRYATIDEEAARFFPERGPAIDRAIGSLASEARPIPGLFTAASMIATLNAISGAIGVALLVRLAVHSPGVYIVIGCLEFILAVGLFLRYQYVRSRATST